MSEGKQASLRASYNGKYVWNESVKDTGKTIKVPTVSGKTYYMVKDENNRVREVFEVEGIK